MNSLSRVLYLNDLSRADSDEKYVLGQHEPFGWFGDLHNSAFDIWVVGHHIAFVAWHDAIRTLLGAKPGEDLSLDEIRQVQDSLAGYSGVLSYIGSCIDPEEYAAQVRTPMALYFPGFSAKWANDYQTLKSLLKPFLKSTDSKYQVIKDAFQRCLKIHIATANRLVPEGGSLLAEKLSYENIVEAPATLTAFVYDSFFLVCRTYSVSVSDLVAQLRPRLEAVVAHLRSKVDQGLAAPPGFLDFGEVICVFEKTWKHTTRFSLEVGS